MGSYFPKEKELNLLNPESHRIFRHLIESVRSGIFMADKNGNLFFVNQAFAEILGYPNKEEILGLNWAEQLISLDSRDSFLKDMEKASFIRDYEVQGLRKDRSTVLLSVTSNFIRNDKGDVIGVEGVVLDITEKKKLEENLKTEKLKLEQILSFDETISMLRNLDQLVDYIVEGTTGILNADKCSLMLMNKDSRELTIKSAKGLKPEVVSATRVNLGESIAGIVAQEGKSILVKNIEYDQRFQRKSRPSYIGRSFMSVPIRLDHDLIGVINVADKNANERDTFTEIDLKILSAIARQAAVAIENVKLYNELEYLSKVDPLTELCNYRSFVKYLDNEINRVKRYPGILSLLMIDIDNFKLINDTYGHLEGNRLLKEIAELFKNNLRGVDIICRYGGDEFAVILPGTDVNQTQIVAEKLRKKVEGYPFIKGVTLSMGIAGYQPRLSRFDFIVKADRALYQSKKDGKNRISVVD